MFQIDAEKELTSEQRVKIMSELPKDLVEVAQKVHKAVNASSAEDFLNILEVIQQIQHKLQKSIFKIKRYRYVPPPFLNITYSL